MNRVSIGSDNGLLPIWHQAITWTNAGLLTIGLLGTNFSEILIRILPFSFKKMHLSSAKMASILSRGRWVEGLLQPDRKSKVSLCNVALIHKRWALQTNASLCYSSRGRSHMGRILRFYTLSWKWYNMLYVSVYGYIKCTYLYTIMDIKTFNAAF